MLADLFLEALIFLAEGIDVLAARLAEAHGLSDKLGSDDEKPLVGLERMRFAAPPIAAQRTHDFTSKDDGNTEKSRRTRAKNALAGKPGTIRMDALAGGFNIRDNDRLSGLCDLADHPLPKLDALSRHLLGCQPECVIDHDLACLAV